MWLVSQSLKVPHFSSQLSQCSALRDDPPPQQRPSCQISTEASRNLKRSSPAKFNNFAMLIMLIKQYITISYLPAMTGNGKHSTYNGDDCAWFIVLATLD